MICNPGMLVLIPFPYADFSTNKKRPVLVLTSPDRHGDFVGMAVTSVPTEDSAIPLTVVDMIWGSLPLQSWVRLDKVYTLDTGSVVRALAEVHADFMARVLRDLCALVGVPVTVY